jgi:hypothetical protein
MKNKPIIITLIILFLVFVAIWIASPRVGEKVDTDTGVSVEFEDKDFDVPDNLPTGFVRVSTITDAVVFFKDENNVRSYYEYIGNNKYIEYDVNKPSYLVKTNFDKRIYQIQTNDNKFINEYRAYDGKTWQVVAKDYNILLNVPSNYTLSKDYPNLYCINEDNNLSYKLLTKIGTQYAWLKPTDTPDWINTTVPSNFVKTDILNVYKGTIDGKETYKKVLLFNDVNKTVAVVSCDKEGKFI